jgi:hypothetical protein
MSDYMTPLGVGGIYSSYYTPWGGGSDMGGYVDP